MIFLYLALFTAGGGVVTGYWDFSDPVLAVTFLMTGWYIGRYR